MSGSVTVRGRARLALSLLPLAAVVATCSLPGSAGAIRPVLPADAVGQPCPAVLPKLHVHGPAKRVSAPGRARVLAQIGTEAVGSCFRGPTRICLRVQGRDQDDLKIQRRCFRRGGEGSRLSKKVVFMIGVRAPARGTYSLLARSRMIRPAVERLRYALDQRARTKLRVRPG